jgi:hypothetical protein
MGQLFSEAVRAAVKPNADIDHLLQIFCGNFLQYGINVPGHRIYRVVAVDTVEFYKCSEFFIVFAQRAEELKIRWQKLLGKIIGVADIFVGIHDRYGT